MRVSGIICEYNPFHLGHARHIELTRRNGATHIAAVMSGDFVQRGDVAVLDKLTRAQLAVKSGADLVIELPVQYSLAPGEEFARAGIRLLDSLGAVDEISFGSECGDVEQLKYAAEQAENVPRERLVELMESGMTYPRAMTELLRQTAPDAAEILASPNNILGVEYIRAIRSLGSQMEPFTIKRTGAPHDSTEDDPDSVSASLLRMKLAAGETDLSRYTVTVWAEALKSGNIADIRRLEPIILYRLRTCTEAEIAATAGVAQGLEHRIFAARSAPSLDELLNAVKTKRYTMARLRRMVLALTIGITKEDMTPPPYLRILALNERGREILARAKGRSALPIGTSPAKLARTSPGARRCAELGAIASDIYGLAAAHVTPAGADLRSRITIDLE